MSRRALHEGELVPGDDFLQPDDERASEDEAEHLADDAGLDDLGPFDDDDDAGPSGGGLGLTPPTEPPAAASRPLATGSA